MADEQEADEQEADEREETDPDEGSAIDEVAEDPADADTGDGEPDALASIIETLAKLDGKLDALSDSLANFREQVAAMKIESGAVVRDDPSGDEDAVSDLPDPYKRDYTI